MMNITNRIKSKYGSLKHYAKCKNINYGSLRCFLTKKRPDLTTIKNILQKDGFLKDELNSPSPQKTFLNRRANNTCLKPINNDKEKTNETTF